MRRGKGKAESLDRQGPQVEVSNTGDARATNASTAITGARTPTGADCNPTKETASVDGSGSANAANGSVAISGYVAGDVKVVHQPAPNASISWPAHTGHLPRELRPLFGREAEVAEVLETLKAPGSEGHASVVVTGPPGIGKSVVALHLSRLVADEYPDGQFHIDLALSAGEGGAADIALEVLHALRPADTQLPEGRAQQLALLRTILSQSRVLLLVDDVKSEQGLLEVLHMDGPFALVCTSRAKLSGLSGLVRLVGLEPLPIQHGEELVRAVAGADRLTDAHVSALARACAGHPLSLHIAAAHLARRPRVSVDRYLEQITSPERGVQALTAGQTALKPVLERSFAELDSGQSDLFSTLGALPHMSLTVDVIAAATKPAPLQELDSEYTDEMADLLDSLFELSLIEQIDEERFVLHEILHRFARHKSSASPAEHQMAIIQNACHMLTARVQSATESIGFTDKDAMVPAESNADALRMLDADRPGSIALVESACQHRLWDTLVLLSSKLTGFLRLGSHWGDLDRIYQCVLEAGKQSGNPDWSATALHNRAAVAAHLGESQRAADLYYRCAETAQESDDPAHLFLAQLSLGTLLINLGKAKDAIPYLRSGLPYWRAAEHRQALASALENLGQAYLATGRLTRAEHYLRNSRNVHLSDGSDNVVSSRSIISLLHNTGRPAEAAREAIQGIKRAQAVGSREWEAQALMDLAEAPTTERPESAPTQPLETALKIFRETGNIQGQVRALYRLGEQAAERADITQAVENLGECAQLADNIGDHEHASRALAYIASYHGGVGRFEEAEACFSGALDMARDTGTPAVVAQALQKRAEYLWHLGRVDETVDHLTEAAQHLADTEEKRALAQINAALGEALVVAGRWQEGARTLRSVVSVLSDHASRATRARATRALAILYSRRGLHTEAMSAITKALDECEKAGDTDGALQCRMALGGVYARNARWSPALEQYEGATRLAKERSDLHVLITAQSQAAVCRLHSGEAERAVAQMAKLVTVAERLGMQTVQIALQTNLGTYRATAGDYLSAAAAYRTALGLGEQAGDRPMRATCLLNLARAEHQLGDTADSCSHARQAFALHHDLCNWLEAGMALVHLGALHQEATPDSVPTLQELLGDAQPVDSRVFEALRSLASRGAQHTVEEAASQPSDEAYLPHMRKINASESVLKAMDQFDLGPIIMRFGASRQTCAVCELSIDETGEAELLYLQHPEIDHPLLRLAHPHCHLSEVIHLDGPAPKQPCEGAEAECILFAGDQAGVIIDWYGGWGSLNGSRRIEDLALKLFRDASFINLQSMLDVEDSQNLDFRDIPAVTDAGVQARLEDNKLSITSPVGPLLTSVPLNFYAHWYEKARRGSLTVIVGRNLQGMAADDPTYLVHAMARGETVGANIPLTVVRPRRNSPCPCRMRSGRKFKHCCGKRNMLT